LDAEGKPVTGVTTTNVSYSDIYNLGPFDPNRLLAPFASFQHPYFNLRGKILDADNYFVSQTMLDTTENAYVV